MKKPKMVLFDYGETLVHEEGFSAVRGNAALLEYASENKYGCTSDQVAARAVEMTAELGRIGGFDPARRAHFEIEVPSSMFNRYLFESLGIKLDLDAENIDRIFWNAASPGVPTDGMDDFLDFLSAEGIRTGVISNISVCEKVVSERINSLLLNNSFEFIITTSSYIFRKPNRRIFELALEKAGLSAGDVWYVGDRYEFDIVGSSGAGMIPVLYTGARTPAKQYDGVLTVSSWEGLASCIAKLD